MKKLALALLLAFPLASLAAPVEPGHFLPRLTLKNQHDQEWHEEDQDQPQIGQADHQHRDHT